MAFPPTVDHFIGQRAVIDRFKVALEASWNDGTRLPHVLLVGPPGVGKTCLGGKIAAAEMGVNVVERIGQVLGIPPALNGLLLELGNKDICFIDEIHELPAASQTLLYRALDDRCVFVNGRDDRSLQLPTSDFTLIGATTDEFLLLPPLRDRFQMILQFTHYQVEALTQIVTQRARMMKLPLESGVAEQIAARSHGTPRLAIRLLESCHRYARSLSDDSVTMNHFHKTLELEGLDDLGLSVDEQRYLRLLAQNPTKPLRLNSLSASLGIHPRTVQTVIEPLLLRLGLIERDKGRVLTQQGLDHVSRNGCHANA